MKRSIVVATFVAAGFAVGLAAQTPTPSSQTTRPSDTAREVKITGCVERAASDASAGTTGTTGTSGTMTRWVLANATMSSSTTGGGTTSSGTSGTTSSTTASRYRLDTDDSKISSHVGHKVEISGTIEDPGTTPGSSATSTSGTAGTSASSSMNEPRLKVDSVRMISSSCS